MGNLRKLFGSHVLGLLLVNMLHKHPLVLEHITLDLEIQTVIPEQTQHKKYIDYNFKRQ